MYDHVFAEKTLNSVEMNSKACMEVSFLVSKLNLPEGAAILDVPCGTGRHSRLFSEKGFRVTGVDINPACLEIARKNPHLLLQLEEGNLQNLSDYREKFDCVLNLFTSFGYFSTDEENRNVMKELVAAVRPGGKLVLNLLNRNFLMSVFQPVFTVKSGNTLVVNASKYDSSTHLNECWMTMKDEVTGEISLSYHRLRLYSPDEIIRMMKECGMVDIQVYGDYKDSTFNNQTSSHPFYIGTRAS